MNTINIISNLKKFGLVLSLIVGFILFSGTAAQAQYRDNRGYGRNDRYGNYGGYRNDIYRIAQQNGYSDGLREGNDAARNRRYKDPRDISEYKKATNGYDSRLGNKNEYKQAYRQAFLEGFDEAQNNGYNNGRYGNRNRRNTSNNGINILRRVILGY